MQELDPQQQAIQEHLNKLQNTAAVQAALLCFHPSEGAQEFSYLRPGSSPELLEELAPISKRFRAHGVSEQIDKPLAIGAQTFRLICHVNGNPPDAPYILAVVAAMDKEVGHVRKSLSRVASKCVGEAYSIKWK